ncbi:hypothetical protein CPB97_009140, partial [Podila verticillata]
SWSQSNNRPKNLTNLSSKSQPFKLKGQSLRFKSHSYRIKSQSYRFKSQSYRFKIQSNIKTQSSRPLFSRTSPTTHRSRQHCLSFIFLPQSCQLTRLQSNHFVSDRIHGHFNRNQPMLCHLFLQLPVVK